MLQAFQDAIETRTALDESFTVALNSGAIDSSATKDGLSESVRAHVAQTSEIGRNVTGLVRQVEAMQLVEPLLWFVVVVLLLVVQRWKVDKST